MRSQIHHLELVYPPISNQEAEWLKKDAEVLQEIKRSKIYFIGQKPEAKFEFKENVLDHFLKTNILKIQLRTGTSKITGSINVSELLKHHEIELGENDTLDIEFGDKLIRFWITQNNEEIVLDWFTTEKLLFDIARKYLFFSGFNGYKKFTKYNLHYIGISKKEDSFSRLVVKPHDKRLRILSNQHPLSSGSRLTDEIFLFFFDIKSLEIKQYLSDSDFDNFGKNELEDRNRIYADAEKAFVKILNTEYNEVKFKNYPKSTDGLFSTTVDKHSFSINENLEFITEDNIIYGERDEIGIGVAKSDFIFIDKETNSVELIKQK